MGLGENKKPHLTCGRSGFLDNVLDSKVDPLIQDHSNQVEYLHPIRENWCCKAPSPNGHLTGRGEEGPN